MRETHFLQGVGEIGEEIVNSIFPFDYSGTFMLLDFSLCVVLFRQERCERSGINNQEGAVDREVRGGGGCRYREISNMT